MVARPSVHSSNDDGERNVNKKDVVVFKCPYSQSVMKMGIPQEFKRLKRELQQMRGSDVLRDTRCVVALQVEVTAGENESPGGRVTWASHTVTISD